MTYCISRLILFLSVLFCVVHSETPSTTTTQAVAAAGVKSGQIEKGMEGEEAVVDVLSETGKENLYATGVELDNALSATDQTVTYPLGLTEGQAAELTQISSGISDLKNKITGVDAIPDNALKSDVERNIVEADRKLAYVLKDLEAGGDQVVPSIPSEVTVRLAQFAASSKAFTVPQKKPEPAQVTTTAHQAERLLAKTPTLPQVMRTSYVSINAQPAKADATAAGDDDVDVLNDNGNDNLFAQQQQQAQSQQQQQQQQQQPLQNKSADINKALTRLDKKLKKTEKRTVPLFHGKVATQSKEFQELEERMKSLESTMKQMPSLEKTKAEQARVVSVRNDVEGKLKLSEEEGKGPKVGASHADISAEKVRLMTDLVRNLDELGRFFGEEEIVDEDDFLSVKEDPKIAFAEENLNYAAGRLKGDLKARPNLFADEYRLEDIQQYLSHPVAQSHLIPNEPAKNLDYLRNLRNYVVSLKEKENRA